MAYRDSDGMLRGKRGGLSGNNSREQWRRYYEENGHSPNFKRKFSQDTPPSPPSDSRNLDEIQVYEYEKESFSREKELRAKGIDPDDPDADLEYEYMDEY